MLDSVQGLTDSLRAYLHEFTKRRCQFDHATARVAKK